MELWSIDTSVLQYRVYDMLRAREYSIECDRNVAYSPGGSNGMLKGNIMCSYLLKPEPVNKPVIIPVSCNLQNRSIQGCIINAT